MRDKPEPLDTGNFGSVFYGAVKGSWPHFSKLICCLGICWPKPHFKCSHHARNEAFAHVGTSLHIFNNLANIFDIRYQYYWSILPIKALLLCFSRKVSCPVESVLMVEKDSWEAERCRLTDVLSSFAYKLHMVVWPIP